MKHAFWIICCAALCLGLMAPLASAQEEDVKTPDHSLHEALQSELEYSRERADAQLSCISTFSKGTDHSSRQTPLILESGIIDCWQPVIEWNTKSEGTADAVKQQAPREGRLSRWFELQAATIGVRYRFIENSNSVTTNRQAQHSESFRGRFKFDRKGSYSVTANLSSGNSFMGTWNTSGIGTGDLLTNLYLKHLYFTARPARGVEVQYGGLAVTRGESTEITSYDNDAYLVGQRVAVRRPKDLFFDEIAVTYAYLGDLNQPSFTKRWRRLAKSNYHQFMFVKKLGELASVSADYTFQSGVETLREAVRFSTKELGAIDVIRFETYQRLDVNRDWGFAVSGEKTLFKRLMVGVGYSQIDRNYGGLNGDRYNRGKQAFLSTNLALGPEFSVQTFIGRGLSNDYPTPNRTRVDLIFSYNLLKSLQRTGIF